MARNDSPGTGPRIAWGATPADVYYPLDQARASARRSKARIDSGGTPPRIGRGAIPADVHCRFDQARASARRSVARIDSGGTPRLEMGKCTTTAQTRINTGVFIVVQVYKNRRKRTRIEREAYKNGVYLYTPTTTESRINTGFFLYLYTFGFQVGGCTRTQFPCCCRAGKLPFGGNFGKPLDNRPGRVYNNTSVKQSGAGGSHPCSPV